VNHQGVAIYGGNVRPHIALLEPGRLLVGTNTFIRKTIDLYRANRGGGAVDANAQLRALVGRAGSSTAVWAAGVLTAEDRDLLRSSDVSKWAADVREIFAELALDGGWRSTLHLDLKDQNKARNLETDAKRFLASTTRAPTGVIELLLANTQASRSSTTVRLQTTLATARIQQMLSFITGQDGCYNGYLQAVRSANPPGAEDAEDPQAGGKRFKVPIELRVIRGNAGNHEAMLSFRTGTAAPVTCRYRGGSSQQHPTSPEQIQRGLKYLLTTCTGGITGGAVVAADWVKLNIAGADAQAGQALVQAHLVCL
jgi:hypothetical protein